MHAKCTVCLVSRFVVHHAASVNVYREPKAPSPLTAARRSTFSVLLCALSEAVFDDWHHTRHRMRELPWAVNGSSVSPEFQPWTANICGVWLRAKSATDAQVYRLLKANLGRKEYLMTQGNSWLRIIVEPMLIRISITKQVPVDDDRKHSILVCPTKCQTRLVEAWCSCILKEK